MTSLGVSVSMLAPEDRRLLTDSFRPPDGYELSWAVGTTFTLDLPMLLAAPLSFALFDLEGGDREQGPDPLAMFESLRRYAARMAIFCQAGQIRVPPPDQPLYAYLEGCVFQARAPARHALFHPKVWLLRFESIGAPAWYRLICMTRNLTPDRSWDAAVMLEGEVLQGRVRAFSQNHPLGDFVGALPSLAAPPLPPAVRAEVSRMAKEVRRVRWHLPEGFTRARFWPLGIPQHNRYPFETRIERLLIISPFLSAKALSELAEGGKGDDVLVSRLEALQELGPKDLRGFGRIFAFNDTAYLDLADEQAASPADLAGLHAKIYVGDAGWKAHVWVGSANATEIAFGGNVEFLVELEGKKSKFGIDALFREAKGTVGFANLLVPYQPRKAIPPDDTEERLRLRLDETRRVLAEAGLVAWVEALDGEKFAVRLTRGRVRRLRLPPKVTVWCWPIRVSETFAQPLLEDREPIATFELTLEELTSFFAFRMDTVEKGHQRIERFTLNLTLEGAPPDRHQRILRSILKDRDRLVRFLLFLLADGDAEHILEVGAQRVGQDGQESPDSPAGWLPLFEALVRALDRNPATLDRVAAVIDDLKQSPEGRSLIPEGFDTIWEPIWEARRQLG